MGFPPTLLAIAQRSVGSDEIVEQAELLAVVVVKRSQNNMTKGRRLVLLPTAMQQQLFEH